MQCSPYTCSWNSIRAESLRVLVVGLHCTIARMFSCSSVLCLRARTDETWALGSVPHSRNVLNTVKHSTIRNPAHRKPSTVFFNSSSGTAIAKAIYIHHISILGICEDVRHFSQHSNNVTINNHNSQLTFHTVSHDSNASYLGNRSEWSMTCWLVPLF